MRGEEKGEEREEKEVEEMERRKRCGGDVLNVHTWVFQRVKAHHDHSHSHTYSHSHSHNDTQPQPHTQQPTNLRLNVPQRGKTHQV